MRVPASPSPDRALTAPGAVRLESVAKTYGTGSTAVQALRGISLDLAPATFTAVMGPSGSGKSTFLQCAAGLDRPTSGSVRLGDVEITALSRPELARFRRDRVGFVFQAYNLLQQLSVAKNIALPLLLAKRAPEPARVRQIAAAVGLTDLLDRMPRELSGGQQQRVAIARALIMAPAVLFADEPTGALDSRSCQQVLQLLRSVSTDLGQTVVLVTHDPVAAAHADRVLFLADGRLTGHLDQPDAHQVAEHMTRLGAW